MTKRPTNAKKVLNAASPTADAAAKRILMDVQIAALILMKTYPDDFKGMSFLEVQKGISNIKDDSYLDDVDLWQERIDGDATESEESSGLARFDVRFTFNDGKTRHYLINLEMQRSFSTDRMISRMLFYLARIVSDQKEKHFKNDRYQDMLPVRQLWIFPDRYQENGLIRFTFQAEEIIKTYPEGLCERLNDRCHYMIQSCFAFLSDDSYHNDENNVLKMLGELFCNPDRTEAIDYLRKEGLKMETQLVTAVEDYNEMKCYSKREYEDLSDTLRVTKREYEDLSNENQGLSKELNFAKKQAQRQQLICQKAQEQHYPLDFALLFSDDSYLEEMERKFQI